jgi:hypothetical protein
MLDPFTAAKLAAILASQAMRVLGYITNVHEAPVRSQQLRGQLRIVVQLAESIERLLKDEAHIPIASLHQAMTEFRPILDQLNRRLQEASTSGVRRLLWPFNEAETDKYLVDIEHYKTTFISFFVVQNV